MAAKQEGQELTNGERLDSDKAPSMDDAPMPHLLAWWFEMGPVASGGAGPVVIPWHEVEAWQQCTGVRLTPWESGLMRELSRAFIDYHEKAKNGAPSPLIPPQSRDEIQNKVKGVFSQLRSRSRR